MGISVSHIGKKWAYYNDVDPFCCEWVRNLIKAGHVAPGVVDERPIEAVQPEDLGEFCQVHMFCGIAVWSHALRSAGWEDARPVWSGSCPCQPFSCAGKQLGTADKRHLWPAWFRLICECKPSVVVGEQVAGPAALAWLDLVSVDLEDAGYAVGAADLCAAGVGAPHIRQRLYWMGVSDEARCGQRWGRDGVEAVRNRSVVGGSIATCGVAHTDQGKRGWVADGKGCQPHRETPGWEQGNGEPEPRGAVGGMADSAAGGQRIDRSASGDTGHAPQREPVGGMEHANCSGQQRSGQTQPAGRGRDPVAVGAGANFWSDADWLPCSDGKARPVEPGTFPLDHGVAGRVGRLRAYGNSLCAPVATEFVRAAMEVVHAD